MTYDASDGYVLMFGGFNGGYTNDTNSYYEGEWTYYGLGDHPPPGRSGPGMTYDAADGYVLLFGGFQYITKSLDFGDTWTYHAGKWTQFWISPHPSNRSFPQMTYDPLDQEVVLFGGRSLTNGTIFSDTWTFKGGVWTNITAKTHPSSRYDAGFTQDAQDGFLLLFGGRSLQGKGIYLADSWKFVGGAWTNITSAPSPAPRNSPYMSWFSDEHQLLLFGGYARSGTLNDTWTFSVGTWTQFFPGSHPPPHGGGAASDDPPDRSLIIYGGWNSTTPWEDAWYWGNVTLTANATAAPMIGAPPLLVSFTGHGWWGTFPYLLDWSFGDGSPLDYYQWPSHQYNASGNYSASLTVLDNSGHLAWSNLTLHVTGPVSRLTSSASASPTSGTLPLTVAFSSSVSGGTPLYAYAWRFADGSRGSAYSDPTHVYNSSGTFQVKLFVNDSGGHGVIDWLNITVTSPPPPLSVGATTNVTLGLAPLVVGLRGSAAGGSPPYFWSWTFGDGGSSTTQNATHTYSLPGTYAVHLVVTDIGSRTASGWLNITATSSTVLGAAANANVTSGAEPLTVGFAGAASGGSPPYAWLWTFGDGASATTQNATHTYVTTGTFPVDLVVRDGATHSVTTWLNVTVNPAVNQLASVSVSPASDTISVGTSAAFAAVPSCSAGPCSSGATLVWTLTNALGSLSSTTGNPVDFTAGPSPGADTVFVNATLRGTTVQSPPVPITIASGGPQLLGVSIVPPSWSLAAGSTATFTASSTCSASCPSGVSYSWVLSNGLGRLNSSTTRSVLFAAGGSAGSVALSVTASLTGTGVHASAIITISPPSPLPKGGGGLPGMSTVQSYVIVPVVVAVLFLAVVLLSRRRTRSRRASSGKAEEIPKMAAEGKGARPVAKNDPGQGASSRDDLPSNSDAGSRASPATADKAGQHASLSESAGNLTKPEPVPEQG